MTYIESMLAQWEAAGVFDFVLPFLLIFVFVFGVLSATSILGSNRVVHVILALVIGILALQVPFVRDFFPLVFGRLGVAIAIILVFVILAGIFVPDLHRSGWAIGFYSLGGVAALLVVFNAFSELNFFGSQWWYDWGAMMIGALFIIGIIIAVSVSGKPKSGTPSKTPATFSDWRAAPPG